MPDHKKPLYFAMYESLKENIINKAIKPGSKLPSIRSLARNQNISTTTVENAYQQLLIEGYIESKPKSGYYALDIASPPKINIPNEQTVKADTIGAKNDAQNPDAFKTDLYRKIVNNLYASSDLLFTPCHHSGEPALKSAIQSHLHRMREVFTTEDSIIITSGIQQMIVQLTPYIKNRSVAYLTPGFKRALNMFETLGYELIGCETTDELTKHNANLIYLSPSNTYPSGEVIPIQAREKLIQYAQNHDAYILEDDYNHLFRYNAYQIPAMISLSGGEHVIYIGSFSRNTLISMRLGYMILPPSIKKRYDYTRFTQTVSKIEQLAMAEFIHKGHYQRHLKQLANKSKRQNDLVKQALKPYMDVTHYSVYGLQSNMHFVVDTKTPSTKLLFEKTLKALNLTYRTFEDKPYEILVPYSGIPKEKIAHTIAYLFTSTTNKNTTK